MMQVLSFFVEGEPRGKARPRFARGKAAKPRWTWGADGKPHCTPITEDKPQVYSDPKSEAYEKLIRLRALEAMDFQDFKLTKEPVQVSFLACFSVPKSYSAKRRLACLSGCEKHTKRPDIDNITKALLDGMNKQVWEDDRQVVEVCGSKTYSEVPGVKVIVSTLPATHCVGKRFASFH